MTTVASSSSSALNGMLPGALDFGVLRRGTLGPGALEVGAVSFGACMGTGRIGCNAPGFAGGTPRELGGGGAPAAGRGAGGTAGIGSGVGTPMPTWVR